MKVLQLGKFYPIRGGVEKVMWEIADGLTARGYACDMLCADAGEPWEAKEDGVSGSEASEDGVGDGEPKRKETVRGNVAEHVETSGDGAGDGEPKRKEAVRGKVAEQAEVPGDGTEAGEQKRIESVREKVAEQAEAPGDEAGDSGQRRQKVARGWKEKDFNGAGRCLIAPTLGKMAATMISPAMVRWLRKHCGEYDIIHVHHPDPMACLALRLSGYKGKVVLHWHSDILKQKFFLKFYKPLQGWLVRRADRIVCTSPVYAEGSEALADVQGKITVIPIGVEPVTSGTERAERTTGTDGTDRTTGNAGGASGIERVERTPGTPWTDGTESTVRTEGALGTERTTERTGKITDPAAGDVKAAAGDVKAAADGIRERFGGRKIVFSLGRLVGYKGYRYLVEAASRLPEDYVVVIGGEGPLREELESRIDALGLKDKVILTGRIEDEELPAWFHACDVFCLSSIWKTEAFAIVQIEAMSCAKPVVATKIKGSGVSWVNQDGVSGINVEPEDAEALAEAITVVCGTEYENFCLRARERYERHFTREGMIENCLKLYETV